MTGAIASFTCMIIAVRMLTDVYGTSQIVVFRSVTALIILVPVILRGGIRSIATRRFKTHFFRNAIHFAGQWGWVYGVAFLTMAEVISIEFTMPLWASLLAAMFLGEKLSVNRLVAIFVGFCGVIVILRPGMSVLHPAAIVVVGAAFCFAASLVVTKAMTRSESAVCIIFWMNLIQLPMGGALAATVWQPLEWQYVPFMFMTGAAGLGAHYCMARALSLADTSVMLPIDFMRLPVTAVAGYLLYEEIPSWFVFFGAAMIFGSNYYSVWVETKRKTGPVPKAPPPSAQSPPN
jgi:drug/metabolite transporter (DMT)-like permease